MKKRLLAITLLAAMLLTACSGGKTDEKPEGGNDAVVEEAGEKVLYTNGGPQEFFEAPWLNPGTFVFNKVLFDRLISADENLNPIAGEGELAESYTVSEDGMEMTFVIRENAKWHDGEPVTPADVIWSIEYALKAPALNTVFKTTFEAISEMTSEGNSLTIKFGTIAPDALLTFSQFAPLPAKYFEGVDASVMQQAEFFQSPVGSGPFKVKEVEMNNYTILEPNQGYHTGVADYNIHLNPSPGDSDPNFVTNAKAGKLDYGYTKSIADVQALEGTEGINIEKVDVRYTRLFYLNKFNDKDGNVSPVADIKVRQALRYALDMPAILDGIFDGAAVPANSLTPDEKPADLNNYDYNPEKSKELLAEAGWDANTEIDLVYYYTDQQTVDLMTIIQHYWSEVGVTMNFRLVEGDLATILWKAPEDGVNGPSAVDWDICYAANGVLSLHEYYDKYQTGYSINSHTPSDTKLDALIAATNATADPELTKEAFYELQRYENEQLFVMPLYYQPVFVITSDKIVTGTPKQGNPQFNYNWNIQNWELK